ncbi:RNA polymerase II mediator complex subunit [Friedmanniomyces endolithicus]|uniref:Mediator of RNA polymerase II transcription subunit 21 n=1 Tax=Friedmanniomyces endolithicus TaxID=329885 RepID=A0AAN6KZ20_9PEZI|nr:RNA polymerase II mediator complex subunit [Friedmanniomyces endolithicus]KAK0867819.1 RNA polymerase II mediator complex subunit [Friedmanniomyces endolithicus]KAK1011890.1 RNA polymerase II mediator complex subunit [Friedmanniomyces endolithicus]KAK1047076.1 RNA polymerase II mediator complex subunit [Friedmanniomyces endolithicus]
MADRLTQLQDAIDNSGLTARKQLTLMYASINYIKTRHPYGEIPGQPSQAPPPAPLPAPTQPSAPHGLTNGDASALEPNGPAHSAAPAPAAPNQEQPLEQRDGSPPPERPDAFNAALHELARDLVLQEQQIELLINSLPGLGNSEVSQELRMRELEAELREVEVARAGAEEERERMVDALGELLAGTRRVH